MSTPTTKTRPLTVKQEAYCLRLFKGENQREAYIQVYHPNGSLASIDVRASDLAHNTKVIVRLKELRDALESPDIGTVKERQKRLTDIYRAQIVDFISPSGEVSISRETPHHAAVSEYSVTQSDLGEDTVVLKKTLKLRDPIAAIQEQNRMERVGAVETAINIANDNRSITIIVKSEDGKRALEALKSGKLPQPKVGE